MAARIERAQGGDMPAKKITVPFWFFAVVAVVLCCHSGYLGDRWKTDSQVNEQEILNWTRYAASYQAYADYKNGTRRHYEAVETDKAGTHSEKIRQEGALEVLTYNITPNLGPMHIKASREYVKIYNAVMDRMIKDPREADPDRWGATPLPAVATSS
jgi:hypothetical protein